jgi:hypothetical protein
MRSLHLPLGQREKSVVEIRGLSQIARLVPDCAEFFLGRDGVTRGPIRATMAE